LRITQVYTASSRHLEDGGRHSPQAAIPAFLDLVFIQARHVEGAPCAGSEQKQGRNKGEKLTDPHKLLFHHFPVSGKSSICQAVFCFCMNPESMRKGQQVHLHFEPRWA
jgi:hypothetical protein